MEEIRRREEEAKLGISVLWNGGSGLRVSNILTNFSPFPRRSHPNLHPHLQQQKTVHAAGMAAVLLFANLCYIISRLTQTWDGGREQRVIRPGRSCHRPQLFEQATFQHRCASTHVPYT
jgi:hypothetical protein